MKFIFVKVTGLQLSCEYCKIFKNSFFHKTPPVAAFKKFVNFPGKQLWYERIIDLSFYYIRLNKIGC